jgi:hypothetical protein
MRTITKADLAQQITLANRRGADLALDWAYGQPRVTNGAGSRDLSPRLPKRELYLWLDGYLEAMDCIEEAATKARIEERKS